MTEALVVKAKGEARVDSRIIARELRNQHKAVMALIERYASKFLRWGVLPFEMAKPQGAKGGRPERFALLNENQVFFLLSLSRNTEHVVNLKGNLVQAFKEARAGEEIHAAEYLPGYHALHELTHELAKDSTNEKFVHMNMNKLVNKTVGIEAGARSTIPAGKKAQVVVAQQVAAMAMAGAQDHHDGYQQAKKALGTLHVALGAPEAPRAIK